MADTSAAGPAASPHLLHVRVVAADREVWSGKASFVIARTTEGDIGLLPGHEPVLALLADGVVQVHRENDEWWVAVVLGGFLSVEHDRVAILAESAEVSYEIDLDEAKHDLATVLAGGANSVEDEQRIRAAAARVRAAEKAAG